MAVQRDHQPTAQKHYECENCGAPIEPGDTYHRTTGFYKNDGEFHSIRTILCMTCVKPPEPEVDPTAHRLAQWAGQHGADLQSRDCSYYVGNRLVPESYTDVTVDGETYTLEYVHGSTPDAEDFARWLSKQDLPTLPEPWQSLKTTA